MGKPEAEYNVTYVGKRTLDDFRGDQITGDRYKITKFTPADNDITEYEVTVSTFGEECTCPGGRHKDCKHRRMVREFRSGQPKEDLTGTVTHAKIQG